MNQNETPVEPFVYSMGNQLASRTTTGGPWGCTGTLYLGPTLTCSSCGRPIGPGTSVTYLEPDESLRPRAKNSKITRGPTFVGTEQHGIKLRRRK